MEFPGLRLLAFVCISVLLCAPAKASTMSALLITGQTASGDTISGKLAVDPSTGQVIAADVTETGQNHVEFKTIITQGGAGYAYIFQIAPAGQDCPVLIVGERTTTQSLQAYPGGPLGPRSNIEQCNGSQDLITQGSMSPTDAAPPAPPATTLSGPTPHALRLIGFVKNGPALAGLIMVDPATGRITGADIKTFGTAHVALHAVNQSSNGIAFIMSFAPVGANCPQLIIGERANPASLQDYPGGPVGPRSVYYACDGSSSRVIGALSVTNSPAITF